MNTTDVLALSRAAISMNLAGDRYRLRMLEIMSDKPSVGKLLAATYLKGLYDISCMHASVMQGGEMAPWLQRIDAQVIEYLGKESEDAGSESEQLADV